MTKQIDRAFILGGLKSAVDRLSLAASEQLKWLEGGRIHADELALELDQFLPAAIDNFGAEFSPAVLSCLAQLDSALRAMSGTANAELWSDRAIRESGSWKRIRLLAFTALAQKGWPGA